MNDNDVELKQIHTLSGDILDCKSKIHSIEYKLGIIDKTCVNAKVTIEIGDNRSSTMEWLTKEEVKMVLNRRLQQEKTRLQELEIEYKNITNE